MNRKHCDAKSIKNQRNEMKSVQEADFMNFFSLLILF
jgi:hypothetical protein